ncbi:MAG TPA: hypothetical protein VLF71_00160 [Candidatus Saccharimonadales bacterium]|nr:hypothetical protein [Candidatus Saccharimonadales bacterium]
MSPTPEFPLPSDFPPAELPPSGISFDTAVPRQKELLDRAPALLPVTDDDGYPADAIGMYPYDVVDPASQEPPHAGVVDDVYAAMWRLHSTRRIAVELYFGLGGADPRGYKQVAELSGVAEDTARLWVSEGLAGIRRLLGVPPPRKVLAAEEVAPSPAAPEPPPAEGADAAPQTPPEPVSAAAPAPAARPAAPAPLPRGLTVIFAADVGDQNPGRTIEFDAERYAAALRAQGFTEDLIARRVVFLFAGRTVANWLMTPSGAVGQAVARNYPGSRLPPLRRGDHEAHWPGKGAIAIKAGPHADAHLARATLAMVGKLPPTEEYGLAARQAMRVVASVTMVGGLGMGAAAELALSMPDLAAPLGAVGLVGLLTGLATEGWPTAQARAVHRWRKQFGPIITVSPNTPQPKFPRLRRLSDIITQR